MAVILQEITRPAGTERRNSQHPASGHSWFSPLSPLQTFSTFLRSFRSRLTFLLVCSRWRQKRHFRFEGSSAMFRTIFSRLGSGDKEFIPFLRALLSRQVAGRRINGNRYNRFRHREINDRLPSHSLAHEPLPDRGGYSPSGKAFTTGTGLVVPDPDAGQQLLSIADEPGIPVIIGCAGLSGSRTLLAEFLEG